MPLLFLWVWKDPRSCYLGNKHHWKTSLVTELHWFPLLSGCRSLAMRLGPQIWKRSCPKGIFWERNPGPRRLQSFLGRFLKKRGCPKFWSCGELSFWTATSILHWVNRFMASWKAMDRTRTSWRRSSRMRCVANPFQPSSQGWLQLQLLDAGRNQFRCLKRFLFFPFPKSWLTGTFASSGGKVHLDQGRRDFWSLLASAKGCWELKWVMSLHRPGCEGHASADWGLWILGRKIPWHLNTLHSLNSWQLQGKTMWAFLLDTCAF